MPLDAAEPASFSLDRRLAAEFVGTALLVATVVGSGIMADRLAGGNLAVALLANTVATAGALFVLISILGSISGAHFNPVVTAAEALHGARPWSEFPWYAGAQVSGGICGSVLANLMFALPAVTWSQHARAGSAQFLSEVVATGGLVFVIFLGVRFCRDRVALLVAAYITAAYWFTASTSFANPAVAIARMFSDTFAGIRPLDVPLFVLAECSGAGASLAVVGWLLAPGRVPETAARPRARDMERSINPGSL